MQLRIQSGFQIFVIIFVTVLTIFCLSPLTSRCLNIAKSPLPCRQSADDDNPMELNYDQKRMLGNSGEENDEI